LSINKFWKQEARLCLSFLLPWNVVEGKRYENIQRNRQKEAVQCKEYNSPVWSIMVSIIISCVFPRKIDWISLEKLCGCGGHRPDDSLFTVLYKCYAYTWKKKKFALNEIKAEHILLEKLNVHVFTLFWLRFLFPQMMLKANKDDIHGLSNRNYAKNRISF